MCVLNIGRSRSVRAGSHGAGLIPGGETRFEALCKMSIGEIVLRAL